MNLNSKRIKEQIVSLFDKKVFLIFFALFGSFFLAEMCSTSLLYRGDSGGDSSVFRYVAYAMTNGKIPYRDVFDHKGPLLYLINYLGFVINKEVGVWFFEFISLFITICFVFKIANKVCKNNIFCVITTILSLSLLANYFQGGNLTEEYAVPLIAISIYIFIDYYENNQTSLLKLIICGFCGGCVLMLRPNMAVVWLVFPIFVLINEVRSKNYKPLAKYGVFFVLGVIIAIVPFITYFLAVGALKDFFDVYILFNLEYSANSGSIISVPKSVYQFMTPLIYLAVVTLLLCICKRKQILFNFTYLSCIALTLISLSMSGFAFGHYGMILVPLLTYPLGVLFAKVKVDFFSKVVVSSLLVVVFMNSLLFPSVNFAKHIINISNIIKNESIDEIVNYVDENTNEDDKILVTGNHNILYLKCDRLSASKYSYQSPIVNVRDQILIEFYDEINQEKPSVIIIPKGLEDYLDMQDFIAEHEYLEMLSNDQYTLYQQKDE